jgi:hypothetical protein
VKSLKTLQRKWLRRLAIEVSGGLSRCLPPHAIRLKPLSELKPFVTDTAGWFVCIGSIRGNRSTELQVWLDEWVRADSRRVCFCLGASRVPPIEESMLLVHGEFGRVHVIRDEAWKTFPDGQLRLVQPLPPSRFGRPLAELYSSQGSGSFLSLYDSGRPVFSKEPSRELVRKGVSFFSRLIEAIRGAQGNDSDFPDEINKAKVRLHLVRERSARAARAAKVRDSFRCRVCDFSLSHMYGQLGEGVAEAHHTVPLSKIKLGARVRHADLITVCANYHRMLHRLAGGRDNPKLLRQMIENARSKLHKRK